MRKIEDLTRRFSGNGQTQPAAELPRVLVVGAGFAERRAVRTLRDAPVDVVLVDRNDYHEFQRLRNQVLRQFEQYDRYPEAVDREVERRFRELLRGDDE